MKSAMGDLTMERGGEKRNKRGKNGTKGQLFITLCDGAGGRDVIQCVVESMRQTHTYSHQQTTAHKNTTQHVDWPLSAS